jgi:hypothetical protein
MASLPLIFAASKRSAFPEAVTVNCLVERDPTSQAESLALIARPGLEAFDTIGTAPTRALFQKQGLFDNSALILASQTLYTLDAAGAMTTFTGVSIAGDNLVDIDAALDADLNSLARIATGDAMYKATGGVVTQEDFPSAGGAGATSVAQLSGYWLGTEAGTDAVFYIIPAGVTWNALQFASAEYAPDRNVCIRVVGETAWLLGEATTEGWRATGEASSPLEPWGGLKFDFGCRARSAAVNCNGTLIWVDHNCSVRMTSGGEPVIISDNGLAEQIRRTDAADLRASFFVKDQHPVYVLTLGTDATWLYDLASKTWTRANSAGYDFWRADLFCNIGDTVLTRDALSNQIYRLDPDRSTDGTATFTMEFSAYVETKERNLALGNLDLHCEVGGSPRSGQGSDPLVGMQVSRDGGKTYGPLKYRGLGATGKYLTRPRWTGLGQARAPFGAWFKFLISDPVVRRVSGGAVNAP